MIILIGFFLSLFGALFSVSSVIYYGFNLIVKEDSRDQEFDKAIKRCLIGAGITCLGIVMMIGGFFL